MSTTSEATIELARELFMTAYVTGFKSLSHCFKVLILTKLGKVACAVLLLYDYTLTIGDEVCASFIRST